MSGTNYAPALNSEADFHKLWNKPFVKGKCFKEYVDDIYARSFVFRSFRNEFEKDNLFDEKSVERLRSKEIDFDALEKKELHHSTNYIPGYSIQSFLPSCSKLSKDEMTLCFTMYKELCQHKQLDGKNLSVYSNYQAIIQDEQREFLNVAEHAWSTTNFHRLSQIRPFIVNFTSQLWKNRLERLEWYPKHYCKFSEVSLIDDSGKQSDLSFVKRLKDLGQLPFCFNPLIKRNKVNVYDDGPPNQPDGKRNLKYSYKGIDYFFQRNCYHPEISKDEIAEALARESTAKVVMSGSSFLSLLDNDKKFIQNSWELPIVVKEMKIGENVVFIDKAFPPVTLTATDRIKWFCKKQMYKVLCISRSKIQQNRRKQRKLATYEPKEITDEITELESFGIDPHNGKKDVSCPELLRTSSSGSKIDKDFMGYNSQGESDKEYENEEEGSCSSGSENELMIDLGEESALPVSNENSANNCNEKEMTHTKTEILSKPPCLDPQKLPNSSHSDPQLFSEPDKTIVMYNLWSLKCDTSNVLLKSNLKDLDIIIRCKEGTKMSDGKVYKISPKLEYQPEFGAEIATLSELTKDWGNIHIRPHVNLFRVRLDAVTGDLIMYEKKCLNDLTIEFKQNHRRNPYDKLVSLHSILGQLTELSPGNYLLSHTRENGNFAQLYKEEKNKHTYNSKMKYLNINTENIEPPRTGWLPLDTMIITPTFHSFSRIPATFHPKSSKCTSKLDRKHLSPEKLLEIKKNAEINLKKKKMRKRKKATKAAKQRKKVKTQLENSAEDNTISDDEFSW